MMIKALQVNLLGARIELARESIVTIDHSLGVSQRKKKLFLVCVWVRVVHGSPPRGIVEFDVTSMSRAITRL